MRTMKNLCPLTCQNLNLHVDATSKKFQGCGGTCITICNRGECDDLHCSACKKANALDCMGHVGYTCWEPRVATGFFDEFRKGRP
ncbi:hypothetical protein BDV96DRAFT_343330 [Lophiotrema nucula]|uniref:Uncharacterized protein n=1 Tax=Lophiotrema nucula TaxID=690887 RepID=A0A6A5ZJP2_9PLEO|nr:hypothetical protein BDV96DRAFT_343330 [Lophiotrema nucula]